MSAGGSNFFARCIANNTNPPIAAITKMASATPAGPADDMFTTAMINSTNPTAAAKPCTRASEIGAFFSSDVAPPG